MADFQTGVVRPIECMKEGWEIIKNDYWILFAVMLVGALIGGFSFYILFGAMLCGISYCYLEKFDGRPVVFEHLWKGFNWWLPGLVVTLFMFVPTIFVYLILYFPVLAAIVMGSKLSPEEFMGLLIGAFAVDLVVIVIMVCLHTLIIFSFPLIVDRNLGPFAAMKLSARAVWHNLGGIAGLYGVAFLLSLVAMMTCIGIYFVGPILLAGNLAAYRRVFPRGNRFDHPPPPNYYQNR